MPMLAALGFVQGVNNLSKPWCTTPKLNIPIFYFSSTNHTLNLAKAIADGANSEDSDVQAYLCKITEDLTESSCAAGFSDGGAISNASAFAVGGPIWSSLPAAPVVNFIQK